MATCRVNTKTPLFISLILAGLYFIGLLFSAIKSALKVFRERNEPKENKLGDTPITEKELVHCLVYSQSQETTNNIPTVDITAEKHENETVSKDTKTSPRGHVDRAEADDAQHGDEEKVEEEEAGDIASPMNTAQTMKKKNVESVHEVDAMEDKKGTVKQEDGDTEQGVAGQPVVTESGDGNTGLNTEEKETVSAPDAERKDNDVVIVYDTKENTERSAMEEKRDTSAGTVEKSSTLGAKAEDKKDVPGLKTLGEEIWDAMKIYCTPSLHIFDVTSDIGTIYELYLMQSYQNQNRDGFSRDECGKFLCSSHITRVSKFFVFTTCCQW